MIHEGLENIMFNLIYITLPFYLIFTFNKVDLSSFFRDTEKPETKLQKRRAKQYLTLLGIGMIVLMMCFPVRVTLNHSYDMRQIPILLGFLYLGRRSGFVLFLTMIIARFIIGGSGVYGAFLTNLIFFAGLFVIEPYFKSGRVRKKVQLAIGLTVISTSVISANLVIFYNEPIKNGLFIWVYLVILQSIGMFITIFSIEKFKNDQLIRDTILKAEKSQIVSDLAASVSHEVRNPLTVTKGFLQLALKDSASEKLQSFLGMALEELNHAEKIINDYLTFAKPALDRPEHLNVKVELDKVIQFFLPYANMNGLVIEAHLEDGLWVMGETQKFHQCLSNIIKNAVEASPNGGRIVVKNRQSGELVKISIKDDGTGMTEENLRRIGEPYYSTKEKGTGLGMMVVNSIVKAMKGNLNVESELGRGTEFTLSFPLVKKDLSQVAQNVNPNEELEKAL